MKISEGKCVRASRSLSHILWVLIQHPAARNWGKSCIMVLTTLSKLKLAVFVIPLRYLFSFPLRAVKRWSMKTFQCPQQDLKTPHAKHFPDPAGCQCTNEIDNQSSNAWKGEYFQKKFVVRLHVLSYSSEKVNCISIRVCYSMVTALKSHPTTKAPLYFL